MNRGTICRRRVSLCYSIAAAGSSGLAGGAATAFAFGFGFGGAAATGVAAAADGVAANGAAAATGCIPKFFPYYAAATCTQVSLSFTGGSPPSLPMHILRGR